MSFLNLKKREDRLMLGIFTVAVLLLAISHGSQFGWWALLSVPVYIIVVFLVLWGMRALSNRARRKDLEDELTKLSGETPERRESAWSKLWSPKRDR